MVFEPETVVQIDVKAKSSCPCFPPQPAEDLLYMPTLL